MRWLSNLVAIFRGNKYFPWLKTKRRMLLWVISRQWLLVATSLRLTNLIIRKGQGMNALQIRGEFKTMPYSSASILFLKGAMIFRIWSEPSFNSPSWRRLKLGRQRASLFQNLCTAHIWRFWAWGSKNEECRVHVWPDGRRKRRIWRLLPRLFITP